MKLVIFVEETATGYSAYAPDFPGCIATGATRVEVEQVMREAIELHFEGMRASGVTPTEPTTYATLVEVGS